MPIGAYFRNRFDSIRAHPIQNLIGGAAGILGGPLAGEGVRRGFDLYNNRQFENAANRSNQDLGDEIGRTAQDIWSKPISGLLRQPDDQTQQLGNALMGGYQGGFGNPGGYNVQQFYQKPSGFTGGSSQVDSILNELPGSPGFKPNVGNVGGGNPPGIGGPGGMASNFNGGSWGNGMNGGGIGSGWGNVANIGMALQALGMRGSGNRDLLSFGGFGPNTLR